MKVLVVSQHFWPENFRVNDLVIGLKERGHDVTVLTGLPNYPLGDIYSEYKEDKSKYKAFHGVKVHRVPVIPRKQGRAINLILNFLSFAFIGLIMAPWKLRGEKFDSIFVFGNSPLTAALPALFISKIKKAPICLWVMDLWPDTLVSMGVVKAGFQEKLARKFVSYIYNSCALVLGQSHSFVDSIKPMTKSQVDYFPSWSDVTGAGDEFNFELGDKFNIVFAGNIGEAQDFPNIIRAAHIIKNENSDVRFVIVGDGRAASSVRNEIAQKQLSEQMLLLGQYPVEQMNSLFSKADALLVTLKPDPAFSKTIPGKVQAYLAAGKPIISMMDGEVFSVISAAKAGLAVEAGDFSGLARSALALSKSTKEELNQYSESARSFYMKEFDRRVLMEKLDRFLSGMKY